MRLNRGDFLYKKKACRFAMQPMISAADYDDVSELVWSTSHW